ncbi:caspase domain-containing protein [Mycena latifolia]|nr:caspase domain-containing protein [Mycena latifolia]
MLAYTGRKKALLIGLCHGGQDYLELRGSHRDAADVREMLIDCYDYTVADITVLIDDGIQGHTQPTRNNLLLAMTALVRDAKAGDHFFFYCAHTVSRRHRDMELMCPPKQTPVIPPKLEIAPTLADLVKGLVPSDGEENSILDNELNATLVAPLPCGSHLVAVLDTSHSGSLLNLKHHRCNRVFVPWRSRGRRNSDEIRHKVVRQNAHLLASGGVTLLAGRKAGPPPRRSSTRQFALARRKEVNTSLVRFPLAPSGGEASDGASAYRRTVSFAPSNSFTRDRLPALSGEFFVLDGSRRCDSPVAMFKCTGWCRDEEWSTRADAESSSESVAADVVSLASCKDSQQAWEGEEGESMTSRLVPILRRNPYQSLKDVLVHISHATHTMALLRHARARKYKAERKALLLQVEWELKRTVAVLGAGPPQRRRSSLAGRAKRLRKLVVEMRQSAGYDMNNFQNPELSSARPLDMERQWRM